MSASGGDGRLGSDGLCAHADALVGVDALAITADGRHAYAASGTDDAVSWFDRDPQSGALTQRGCVKQVVGPRERCALGYALSGPTAIALSADERFVYVVSEASGAVAVFARDAATGALTEQSCISETGSNGQCLDGIVLGGPRDLVVPADGHDIYVISRAFDPETDASDGLGAVVVLANDSATGALSPAGCLMADPPAGGPCRAVPTLAGASSAAITTDGTSLYVAGSRYDTLVTLARDPNSGAVVFEHPLDRLEAVDVLGLQ